MRAGPAVALRRRFKRGTVCVGAGESGLVVLRVNTQARIAQVFNIIN
jgi:hypothetical protein